MNFVFIALVFFITYNANYARECNAESDQATEVTTTSNTPTTISYDAEAIKELIKGKSAEYAADVISKISKQAPESRMPANDGESSKMGMNKAYSCSRIDCHAQDKITPVCACNFITGNVASFRNKCDTMKHNCRFDTNFQVILEEICPWEFEFRRANGFEFDYRDSKYYN